MVMAPLQVSRIGDAGRFSIKGFPATSLSEKNPP
jgi:hypothetical protein